MIQSIFTHRFLNLFCLSAASILLFLANIFQFPVILALMEGHYYSSSIILIADSILLFIAVALLLVTCFQDSANSKAKANLIVALFGWFGVFAGSVIGSPIFDFRNQKDTVNIIAFTILLFSSCIQLFLLLVGPLPLADQINKHFNRTLHILFRILFILFYITGSIAFYKSNFSAKLVVLGAALTTFAAFLFMVSNLFLYEEYYGIDPDRRKLVGSDLQSEDKLHELQFKEIKMESQISSNQK